jgi:pimeloyl-ACP methyl ester carboxylesterase
MPLRLGQPTGLVLALCMLVLGSACVFQDVREQQALIDASCVIEGRASGSTAEARPIVVVLAARSKDPAQPWRVVDHFVLEQSGPWAFGVAPGEYRLGAFEDRNRDLVYQPGEPFVRLPEGQKVACTAGARVKDIVLAIPAVSTGSLETELDIAKLQARSLEDQDVASLGQLTVVGRIANLADMRFTHETSEDALWRPFDFIVKSYAGVYFLERDDPAKTPVLFVHGMSGTPLSFAYLAEHLDRRRFEPWFYYYPTGIHLDAAADHLAQTVAKLQRQHPHERLIVVAHSMGGLVSRLFIQRHARGGSPLAIPLFVTISSPFDGHRGAKIGVNYSPAVVRVWNDMAPGSTFLTQLFATPLPAGTAHHLIFTFNRKDSSFGASDDQAVTVASQLRPAAQAGATRLYGFDDTHTGILDNAELSALLNRLLAESR